MTHSVDARVLLVVAIPLVVVVFVLIRVFGRPVSEAAGWAAVTLYATALVAVAFFPLPLPPYIPDPSITNDPNRPLSPWANVIPLATISSALRLGMDWPAAKFLIGNIVAFVPVGFLVPLILRRRAIGLTIAIGLALSITIEVVQFSASISMGFLYRVADIDDVILNTLGTAIGLLLFVAVDRAMKTTKGRSLLELLGDASTT